MRPRLRQVNLMMLLLFLLALAMMVTGVASAIFGAPIVNLERGHTMIVAGSSVAAAGAVLFGLTFVCYRLKKIQREIRRLGDRLIRHSDAYRMPVVGAAVPAEAAGYDPLEPTDAELLPPIAPPPAAPRSAAAEPAPAPAPERPSAPTIVGKYASGGNSYVMYSDGSIEADTPSGHHTFASLDELKAFVAAGGERS